VYEYYTIAQKNGARLVKGETTRKAKKVVEKGFTFAEDTGA
jgi:hypothetical protein